MINLLPPDIKDQMRYARLNRQALGYLKLVIVVIMVLGGIFATTLWWTNRQAAIAESDVNSKEANIASSATFTAQASAIATRLSAIKTIDASKTHFSLLLDDLAKALPQGVSIDSITLTGDDTSPVRISVTAGTYQEVLDFREAFAESPRISGVDLESIGQISSGYQASVVIGFKPGQAK